MYLSSRPLEFKEISSCDNRITYQKYYKSQSGEAAYKQAIMNELKRYQAEPNCLGSGKLILELYR